MDRTWLYPRTNDRVDDPATFAWSSSDGSWPDTGSLDALVSRAVRYDRVIGTFDPDGVRVAASGIHGLTGTEGRARILLAAPGPTELDPSGGAGRAELHVALDAALTTCLAQARDETELLAYLAARGRLSLGTFVIRGQGTSDLRTYGHPAKGWLSLEGPAGHLVLADDGQGGCVPLDQTSARKASGSFQALWDGRSRPWSEPFPPFLTHRLRRHGERTVHTVRVPSDTRRDTLARSWERLRFAVLKDAPCMPGGRAVGIESAPVDAWPHQAAVARRVVADYPRSWLLADEVGLGKTIECGLALRSLTLSGIVGRALVVPPASLSSQWSRELRSKFLVDFDEARAGVDPYATDRGVVSRSLLSSRAEARRSELSAAQGWDLVVVDEAHAARKGTQLADTLTDEVRDKATCLVLASATPMQLEAREAFDLVRHLRRGGSFDGDDVMAEAYYDTLAELSKGKGSAPTPVQVELLRSTLRELREIDPDGWARIWAETVAGRDGRTRTSLSSFVDEWGPLPTGDALLALAYSAAPLGRCMQRHGRAILRLYEKHGLLPHTLPVREVVPKVVSFGGEERDFHAALAAYTSGLSKRMAGGNKKASRSAAFFSSFVKLRAASSPTAIRRTLERRLAKVEATLAAGGTSGAKPKAVDLEEAVLGDADNDRGSEGLLKDRTTADLAWERDTLAGLASMAAALPDATGKSDALLATLASRAVGPGGRCVVFTRFSDTVDEIVSTLRKDRPDLRLGTFTGTGGSLPGTQGKVKGVERDKVKAAFTDGLVDVLVCTDAAAEGLNLQTAATLVNYDLPWNPAKVEQRIGRIDRIGQESDVVHVVNMLYEGSAEERVYARLVERLDKATMLVGSQQLSLIPLGDMDFLFLASPEVSDYRKEMLLITVQTKAVAAAERAEARVMPPEILFGRYWREAEAEAVRPVPARLGELWEAVATSPTLRDKGFVPSEDGRFLDLPGDEGGRGYRLSVDRDWYDRGDDGAGPRPCFATWGSPVVDAIFRLFGERPLPESVRRIEVTTRIGLRDVPTVGYVVSTEDGAKLVTSLSALDALPVALHMPLTPEDVRKATSELAATAAREFAPALAVARSEARSTHAGRDRRARVHAVAEAMLGQSREDRGKDFATGFADLSRKVEVLPDRATVVTGTLPVQVARHFPDLFQVLSVEGREARVRTSLDRQTVTAALAAAREASESMKKGSGTTVSDVMARLRAICQGTLADMAAARPPEPVVTAAPPTTGRSAGSRPNSKRDLALAYAAAAASRTACSPPSPGS